MWRLFMITLNQDQQAAKSRLIEFIENDTENRIILTGSAGTGKTVTITTVMKEIRKLEELDNIIDLESPPLEWFFTATTNKAKQAIQHNIPNHNVHTIHSLLNLRPYRGNLVKNHKAQPKLPNDKCIVVVDECSYIDKKLLDFINAIHSSIKIIFIGDPNQLTPVKSTTCPVFHQGYPEVKLTTLVRQTNAPKIAEICNKFKEFIESDGTIEFPSISLSSEIVHLDSQQFESLIERVFIQDKGLTLHNRVLAGTNEVVIRHNTNLFGLANGRTKLVPGDTVVSNNYVKGIKTDEEVIIIDRHPFTTSIPNCNGTQFIIQSMSTTVGVYVPDNPKKAYKTIEDIVDDRVESIEKAQALSLYDSYADLRPMYASTIHKSQGSTFETVYIDLNSLRYVRSKVALARLLYVAMSRASKQIILTGDIV